MMLLEGAIRSIFEYIITTLIFCSGGITVTFSGTDLNVVSTSLVIDIIDVIDYIDNSITDMLVEQYNIVSAFRVNSLVNGYV